MGYAGGDAKNPTYKKIKDHTETVQVVYDPEKIKFKKLLEVFWKSHNPERQNGSRQYRNILFYYDDKQKKAARAWKKKLEEKKDMNVQTEISRLDVFYPAENYHQKYRLQNRDELFDIFQKTLGGFQQAVNATTAARVNAYLGNKMDREELSSYLENMPEDETALRKHVRSRFLNND